MKQKTSSIRHLTRKPLLRLVSDNSNLARDQVFATCTDCADITHGIVSNDSPYV